MNPNHAAHRVTVGKEPGSVPGRPEPLGEGVNLLGLWLLAEEVRGVL